MLSTPSATSVGTSVIIHHHHDPLHHGQLHHHQLELHLGEQLQHPQQTGRAGLQPGPLGSHSTGSTEGGVAGSKDDRQTQVCPDHCQTESVHLQNLRGNNHHD